MRIKESLYEYIPGFLIASVVFFSIVSGIGFVSYIGIYYWVLFRFDLVPVTLLGLLGFVYDSYCSPFLGIETSLFAAFAFSVYLDQRYLKYRGFYQLWVRFLMLITLIFIGKWGLFWGLGLPFVVLKQGAAALMTITLFPLYVWGVYPIYRRISST